MKYEVKDTNASSKFVTKYGIGMLVHDIVKELNSVESLKADLAKVTAERDSYKLALVENRKPCKNDATKS